MASPTTIETLVRQTARWSTASLQDESPLIKMLHANYGVAYASALRQVATDGEIYAATGINAHELEQHATAAQDAATVRLVAVAPQVAPEGPLVGLAREGLPTTYGAADDASGVAAQLSAAYVKALAGATLSAVGLVLTWVVLIGGGVWLYRRTTR
jgi:hypothetical protein